jgi:hypothetical protein
MSSNDVEQVCLFVEMCVSIVICLLVCLKINVALSWTIIKRQIFAMFYEPRSTREKRRQDAITQERKKR